MRALVRTVSDSEGNGVEPWYTRIGLSVLFHWCLPKSATKSPLRAGSGFSYCSVGGKEPGQGLAELPPRLCFLQSRGGEWLPNTPPPGAAAERPGPLPGWLTRAKLPLLPSSVAKHFWELHVGDAAALFAGTGSRG